MKDSSSAMKILVPVAMLLSGLMVGASAIADSLSLEGKIPLGEVSGRIDHLAIDIPRKRLYVAELGNNTVGIVDLAQNKAMRNVAVDREPQGIAYDPSGDVVYVASGDQGTASLFKGEDFTLLAKVKLGDDADNVRIDSASGKAWFGYGSGALGALDLKTHAKVSEVELKGHPESFQLDRDGRTAYVNVPQSREIVVVDRAAGKRIASWPTKDLRSNYPLAIDAEAGLVLSVFRSPAMLVAYEARSGEVVAQVATCGDSDDIFVDAKRRRVYVICGEGFVDVYAREARTFRRTDHVATVSGARTGLFIPDLDRLIVAARKSNSAPATLWVFRAND